MGALKRKYKDKEGKTIEADNWTVEFYIDSQRFCKTIDGTAGLSKKKADQLCDELREQKKNELYGTLKTTFDDAMLSFYQDYLLKVEKRRKTAPHKIIKDAYGPIIKTLTAEFTGKAIDSITRSQIVDFVLKRRKSGVKDKTIKNDVNCFSAMYGHAEQLDMCDYKDIPNFPSIRKLLKTSKPKTRYLSTEEFDRLVAACDGPRLVNLRFFIEFDVETGLRNEELLSLRWLDVDIEGKRIKPVDTKNGKDRKVPLSDRAVTLLKQQLHFQQHEKIHTEYVISHADGGRYTWFEGTFKRACKEAKVKCSIHDLRRTFGSWRLQGIRGRKCDLKEVSMMLGHGDTQITDTTYAFLNEENINL